MSKKKPVPVGAAGWRKDLIQLLQRNGYSHDLHQVFSDFVEMGALAYSNLADLRNRDEREKRYLDIVKRYKPEEIERFAHALGALKMCLQLSGFDDVLGSVFMELELGNKWAGQFFTPFSVSQAMARMSADDKLANTIRERGFVTVNDPCTGGGAMLIAFAQVLSEQGFEPYKHMHVTAQDIDIKAVHMTYLQLAILDIPAIVIHGNTLSLECRSLWFTPTHILNGWTYRLQQRDQVKSIPANQQLQLFEEAA